MWEQLDVAFTKDLSDYLTGRLKNKMSVEQMRAILKRQYNGAYKWVNRVNKMSDAQVVAVYHRMLYAHQLK
jgi:hypothetical protein